MGARLLGSSVGSKIGKLLGTGVVGGKEGCNVVVSMVGDTVLAIGDGVLMVGATVF